MNKKLLLTLLTFFLIKIGNAQVAIGYYPFPYSQVEVSSNPEKLLFGNLRMQTNTFIGSAFTNLTINFNIKRSDAWNIYSLAGTRMSPFDASAFGTIIDGYFLGAGLRLKPFKGIRNLAFTMDLAAYTNEIFSTGRFNSNFGISWHFNKKSD